MQYYPHDPRHRWPHFSLIISAWYETYHLCINFLDSEGGTGYTALIEVQSQCTMFYIPAKYVVALYNDANTSIFIM